MSQAAIIHRRAFRYRLRTLPGATERTLRRREGCCRKVWSLALADEQARRARGEKYAGYATTAKSLTGWRKSPETGFLRDVLAHVLQNVLWALDGGLSAPA